MCAVAATGSVVTASGEPGTAPSSATSVAPTAVRVEPITRAANVRALRPEEAAWHRPVVIGGVVTTANSVSCVVQDASGPVYVAPSGAGWARRPRVGERWEFEGVTDPGEFSPIVLAARGSRLGEAELPRPLQPAWEQLVNGSLDVELIELRGILLGAAGQEMTLLLPGGTAKILKYAGYPLPRRSAESGEGSPVEGAGPSGASAGKVSPGALLRVRGVFFAYRDPATRRLVPAHFLLGDARLEIEEAAPADPFALPTRHADELLRFDPGADALRRFKVVGQVLHARPGEFFLRDGDNSLRVRPREPFAPAAGALVEVVGFPRLGGPSPVLIEAVARRTGHAPLPAPRDLGEAELAEEKHDAARVRVEARLAGTQTRRGERVLELQAGRYPFLARLPDTEPLPGGLRAGARLRVTGVYASLRGEPVRDRAGFDGFELLVDSPADLELLSRGPWWTTRHTVLVLALLSAGLVAAFAWVAALRRVVAQRTALWEKEVRERQRIEQRRLLEQERARVARDLHDELGAGLTQIGLLGSMAARPGEPPEGSRAQVAMIAAKARELVGALDEIVWAINPRNDSAGSVRGYLCEYAEEFLRAAGIVCRFDTGRLSPDLELGAQPRHELFLAFKEALANVVKHAAATEVAVTISSDEAGLLVVVEDNGKGIAADVAGERGDGRRNLRARLERIGGGCEIEARPGGGTRVALQAPARA